MKLLVATGNPDKCAEMRKLLEGLPVRVFTPQDFPEVPEVVEDGTTLRENAAKKARENALHCGVHAVADDSGLFVDALDGRPGIHSARYVDGEPTPTNLCAKLLRELEGVPPPERGAEFRCSIAMADPAGRVVLRASGRCEGVITDQMYGQGGFGYDPVFHYEPAGQTFAQMAPAQKNAVSHRGRALRQFRRRFAEYLERVGG